MTARSNIARCVIYFFEIMKFRKEFRNREIESAEVNDIERLMIDS